MRAAYYLILSGAIVGATVWAAVTGAMGSVASSDGNTTVSVVRNFTDPATYHVTICTKGPCPTSLPGGAYTVDLGVGEVEFTKGIGSWGYRVKDEYGKWVGSSTMVNWDTVTVGGTQWCCITAGPLDGSVFGPPAETPNHPVPGKTTYTMTFKISAGNATTSEGKVGWVE